MHESPSDFLLVETDTVLTGTVTVPRKKQLFFGSAANQLLRFRTSYFFSVNTPVGSKFGTLNCAGAGVKALIELLGILEIWNSGMSARALEIPKRAMRRTPKKVLKNSRTLKKGWWILELPKDCCEILEFTKSKNNGCGKILVSPKNWWEFPNSY